MTEEFAIVAGTVTFRADSFDRILEALGHDPQRVLQEFAEIRREGLEKLRAAADRGADT